MQDLKVELTEDADFVHSILTHPDIFYDVTSEDYREKFGENLKDFIKEDMPNHIYFKVQYKEDIAGMIGFHEFSPGVLQGHMNMLKSFRGEVALEVAKICQNIIFNKTQYEKILAMVPSKFGAVFHFLVKLGFKLECMYTNKYKDKGNFYDVYVFSLTKEG